MYVANLETETSVLAVMHEAEELVSGDKVSRGEFLCGTAFHASCWWALWSTELSRTAAPSVWPGSSDAWASVPG